MPELDGLRAVAVSLVVAAHYRLVPGVPGGFGVTLFFFLSGYLITTLFYAEFYAQGAVRVGLFYVRRWLRLTPALAIMVACGCLLFGVSRATVGGSSVPAGTVAAALLYYTNYYDLVWGMAPARIIPFGICWSLAVEEHFYLIWPWVLRRVMGRPAMVCLAITGVCAGVLVWRWVAFYHGFPAAHLDYATDCRIDSILFGALLRALYETGWGAHAVCVLRLPVVRLVSVGGLALSFMVRDEGFREIWRTSAQGVALLGVFTWILTDRPGSILRRVLALDSIVLIGKLSYAIYLFHLLARSVAVAALGEGLAWVGIVLTLVMSYAVFRCVERPLARARAMFHERKRASA